MLTEDEVTEIFCIADDFCKQFDEETCIPVIHNKRQYGMRVFKDFAVWLWRGCSYRNCMPTAVIRKNIPNFVVL